MTQSPQEVARSLLETVEGYQDRHEAEIFVNVGDLRTLCNAVLAGQKAVEDERERCARLVVDVAAEHANKYKNDPKAVPQPYANNRLMHVGWEAADRIRTPPPTTTHAAEPQER